MSKVVLCFIVLFLAACGPIEPGEGACEVSCEAKCEGSPTTSCFEGCMSSCEGPELTAEAAGALSHSASRVYAIAALYYQTDGCAHGSIASDANARCNSPAETVLARFSTTACTPANPTLTFSRTQWGPAMTLTVRRVLRPVVDPPAGLSSSCADGLPGAKWDSSGAEPWAVLGAKGIGSDVSTESASVAIPSNGGPASVSIPLGDVINACAPTGTCVLALLAPSHVWEAPGTFVLSYDCAGPPPVCGDGVKAGSEGCDDGGTVGGDGCSAACAVENGFTCSGAPSACVTTCGDGIMAGAEECDNGAANGPLAPCSAACMEQTCSCQ